MKTILLVAVLVAGCMLGLLAMVWGTLGLSRPGSARPWDVIRWAGYGCTLVSWVLLMATLCNLCFVRIGE